MWPQGEFTWGAAGAWGSFLALLAVIVRQVGPWRKLSIDAETNFRDGLVARVTNLEETLATERRQREVERALREADRALDRHRINNLQTCFDAVLLMLKASPERVPEIIIHIEEMRDKQIKAEALEKGKIHEATIRAAGEMA